MSVAAGRHKRGSRHRAASRPPQDEGRALLGAGAIVAAVAAAVGGAVGYGYAGLLPLLAGLLSTGVAVALVRGAVTDRRAEGRHTLAACAVHLLAWTAAAVWAPAADARVLLGGGALGVATAVLAAIVLLRAARRGPATWAVGAGLAGLGVTATTMVVAALVPGLPRLPVLAGGGVALVTSLLCAVIALRSRRGTGALPRLVRRALEVLRGDGTLPSLKRRVLVVLGLSLALALLELSVGAQEGSHALVADAFHVLDDTLTNFALLITVIAAIMGKSIGQWDVRLALLGGAMLIGFAIWNASETIGSWSSGPAPGAMALIVVSAVAALVNALSLPLLHHADQATGETVREDAKSDFLGSCLGLLAGFATLFSATPLWDSLASLGMCGFMIVAGSRVLWKQWPKLNWKEEERKLPVHQPQTILRLIWLAVALGVLLALPTLGFPLATEIGDLTGLGSAAVSLLAAAGMGLFWLLYTLTASLRWFALASIVVVGASVAALPLAAGRPALAAVLIVASGLFAVTPFLSFERVPGALPSHFGGRSADTIFVFVLCGAMFVTQKVAVELNEALGIVPTLIVLGLGGLACALHATHAYMPDSRATPRSPREELRSVGHALRTAHLWPVYAIALAGGMVPGLWQPLVTPIIEHAIGSGYQAERWSALTSVGYPIGAALAAGAMLIWRRWDQLLVVAAVLALLAFSFGIAFGGHGDVALALLPLLVLGRICAEGSASVATFNQGRAPGGALVTAAAVMAVTLAAKSLGFIGAGAVGLTLLDTHGNRTVMALGMLVAIAMLAIAVWVARRSRSRLELWELPGVTRVVVDRKATKIRVEPDGDDPIAVFARARVTMIAGRRGARVALDGLTLVAPPGRPRNGRRALKAPVDPTTAGLWRTDMPAVERLRTIVVPEHTRILIRDTQDGRYIVPSLRLRATLAGRAVVDADELIGADVRLWERAMVVSQESKGRLRLALFGGHAYIAGHRGRKPTVMHRTAAVSPDAAAVLKRHGHNDVPAIDPRERGRVTFA